MSRDSGGDLYAVPNAATRGATGDVTEVWRDLRQCFGSMVGVMGILISAVEKAVEMGDLAAGASRRKLGSAANA
jgi:hypothetical protein